MLQLSRQNEKYIVVCYFPAKVCKLCFVASYFIISFYLFSDGCTMEQLLIMCMTGAAFSNFNALLFYMKNAYKINLCGLYINLLCLARSSGVLCGCITVGFVTIDNRITHLHMPTFM